MIPHCAVPASRLGPVVALLATSLAWSLQGLAQTPLAATNTDEAQRAYTRRYESYLYGRIRDYTAEAERERSRSPSDPALARSLALAYDAAGNTKAAFAEVERGYQLPGASQGQKFDLTVAGQLIALGARERGKLIYWLTEMGKVNSATAATVQRLIAGLDNPVETLANMQSRVRDPATTENQLGNIAPWLAYFGDAGGALEALRIERSATGPLGTTSLWLNLYREVRMLPGFAQLVRDIGLVDQWRKNGWGDLCKPVGRDDLQCGSGTARTPATNTNIDNWQQVREHRTSRVEVDQDVKVEVVDWGGTGRPLVLLAGLGGTAHVFDQLAPKLTDRYHVYGVTRRGFGVSSAPESGYGADRLADDVLAVLDVLKLDRPVLAGHSIAGGELSSIGSRFPDRVAGLIYLDAHYDYAFGDPDLKSMMNTMRAAAAPAAGTAEPIAGPLPPPELIAQAVIDGTQEYTAVRAPLLAIMAGQQNRKSNTTSLRASSLKVQKKAIRAAAPSARLVYIPEADHAVFVSNEEDVLEEMRAFIASLP